jgi:hypothetical protein
MPLNENNVPGFEIVKQLKKPIHAKYLLACPV